MPKLRGMFFVSLPVLLLVVSCTEQEAQRASDEIFTGIAKLIITFVLLAALMTLLWSLLIAGAITALIAGFRRLQKGKARAEQEMTERSGAPGQPQRPPDWTAVGMISFGAILLLFTAPGVVGLDIGARGGVVVIPLPFLLAGIALIVFATHRWNNRPAVPLPPPPVAEQAPPEPEPVREPETQVVATPARSAPKKRKPQPAARKPAARKKPAARPKQTRKPRG